jgi:2-polyprenyl-3-methyl-5-hydroxy-6-metoxy-1,4-benzoquinol methylase
MMTSNHTDLGPTQAHLEEAYRTRFGDPRQAGPLPKLWYRLGYFVPDVFYEATVARLVRDGANWLDVGCGRGIFPSNDRLAQTLALRCKNLVGVDPDETVEENPLVHVRARCTIEDFQSRTAFDLVTLRMVAEHISRPEPALDSLARLTKPGGKVVVYTVNRWSPASLAAWITPFKLHHAIKSLLWGTEEKDTFPVAYQMNTRGCLRRLFEAHGFREAHFAYLDDLRTFFRIRLLHSLELVLWRLLRAAGLTYPENCLLAVYERI